MVSPTYCIVLFIIELSPSNKIVSSLQAEVTQFRSWLPTLSCLLNPALKIRHWDVIHKTTGGTTPLSGGHSLTIDHLDKMKVQLYSLTGTGLVIEVEK